LDSVRPIPSGTVLYECKVDIAADAAAGTYALTLSNAIAIDPDGGEIAATGIDATIIVALPTATPTATPPPTATVEPTPIATPTATAPATVTPTTTSPRMGGSGSCAVSRATAGSAWWLLLPLAVLRRRRQARTRR
jgi:hypothetical protein